MAELDQVVPGEPIDTTTFGSPVIDRVISRYADAAERDLKTPLPLPGDSAYLEGSGEFQLYNGATWETYAVGAEYLALTGGTLSGDLLTTGGVQLDAAQPNIRDADGDNRIGLFSTFSVWSQVNEWLRLRVSGDGSSYLMRLYYDTAAEDMAYEFNQTTINALPVYNSTSTVAPNLYITSSGNFRRSTAVMATASDLADLEARIALVEAAI